MFFVDYASGVAQDLAGLRAFERARILDQIEEQLAGQPTQETRNKKLLPGLNHIFNETDGTIKSVEEYDRPGYVAVELIDLLESWIKEAEQR